MSPTEEQTYREGVENKLDQILKQVTKTNGRVSSLENWRAYIIGAVSILTVLVLPIAIAIISDLKL